MHRTTRRPVIVLIVTGVLVLGACGGSDKKTAASSSQSASSTSTSSSASSKSASSTSSSSSSTSDSSKIGPILALAVDGLAFVTDPGTKNFQFGTDESTTTTAIKEALGTPKGTDIDGPCDDGSGRSFDSVRYDGLAVYFLDQQLSGWSAEAPTFTTIDGIGPGSKLSDLKASLGKVTVTDSSLGTEFSSDTIGGVLDGKSDDAKVTTMFNGELCIIR